MTPNDEKFRAEHATTAELANLLTDVAESLSLGFEAWDEPYVRGPSLYFVVVADVRIDEYADPLGANRWPVEICRVATDDPESFVEAAREVAFNCDGAVVITADGTIQEQMFRIRSPSVKMVSEHRDVEYADWMGTKHLSALEASIREEVLIAVTLSEEDGRVTVFEDGTYTDYERDELGGRWRPER